MELFHLIEDAYAIVRKPKGVYVQAKLYHRGDTVFVGYGSGFVRLGQKFGETWGTSHPDIKIDMVTVPFSQRKALVPVSFAE